jgi:hypothetical protein
MPYLVGIDSHTTKRWDYWQKIQSIPHTAYFELRTKGLTDKFVKEAIHCHDYPQLNFSQDNGTYSYLNSIIDLISGDHSISGLDAFDFLMDWLLFGFGHEDFTSLPESTTRHENMNSILYEYFDLFPFLMNPYDYFGQLLPELYGKYYKGKVGFFPTPMCIGEMIATIMGRNEKPTIEQFNEPAAGTGSLLLSWSNNGLCASITELSLNCTKASLVNCYLYAPQFARPIWYLLDRNDFFCGNTLSYEITLNYHQKYKCNMADSLREEWAIAS